MPCSVGNAASSPIALPNCTPAQSLQHLDSNVMPGEIVTLQLGNYANYVGAHYWNLQVRCGGSGREGARSPELTCFNPCPSTTPRPLPRWPRARYCRCCLQDECQGYGGKESWDEYAATVDHDVLYMSQEDRNVRGHPEALLCGVVTQPPPLVYTCNTCIIRPRLGKLHPMHGATWCRC